MEIKYGLWFDISDPNNLHIHVHISYIVCALLVASEAISLQTASEVESDLGFEISYPNYLLIHVHIVDMVWALFGSLWGHYSLQKASEVKTESASEIGDPNLLYDQVSPYLY